MNDSMIQFAFCVENRRDKDTASILNVTVLPSRRSLSLPSSIELLGRFDPLLTVTVGIFSASAP